MTPNEQAQLCTALYNQRCLEAETEYELKLCETRQKYADQLRQALRDCEQEQIEKIALLKAEYDEEFANGRAYARTQEPLETSKRKPHVQRTKYAEEDA